MIESNPYAPPQSEIEPITETEFAAQTMASPWIRLGAHVIDLLLYMAILWPIGHFTDYTQKVRQASATGKHFIPEMLVWIPVIMMIFLIINWRFLGQGQTIGKKLLKIRIVRKNGEPAERLRIITRRIFSVWLASAVPTVGPFIALADNLLIFRTHGNTLHDDLADTKVIKVLPE